LGLTGRGNGLHLGSTTMTRIRQPIDTQHTSALVALVCLATAFAADLPVALGPLQTPVLPNAKLAIDNLTQLGAARGGATKSQAARLAVLIKNLFAAEYQLTEAVKAGKQAHAEARRKERNAADWMKPNILGRINEGASRESLAKAAAIRGKAAQRIAGAQQNLVEQLRETDSVIEDFHKLEEFEVVLVLVETSATLASRSLPKGMFTTAFPPANVATAREVLRLRRLAKTQPAAAGGGS